MSSLNSATSKSNKPNNTEQAVVNSKKDDKSLIKAVNSRDEFFEILNSIKDKYVIVEFFAVWCGPCKMLALKFQDVAEKYQDKVEILKVDVDDLEDLAVEYKVKNMPSFMIMRNGEKLEQYFGSKPEQFQGMVKKYLENST